MLSRLAHGAADDGNRSAEEIQDRQYIILSREQERFWASEQDREMLTRILRRLVRLEYVEVTDGEFLDPVAAKRYCLHESTAFGADCVERTSGRTYDSAASPFERWPEGSCHCNGLGHNFAILLKALAATQRPIKLLRVWHWNKKHELDYAPVRLMPWIAGPSSALRGGLAVSLADLTVLSLMLQYSSPAMGSHYSFLPALVNLAPRLQQLTLMFDDALDRHKSRASQEVFLRAFSEFAQTARLPSLRVLDLRRATIKAADLVRLWKQVRGTATEIRLNVIGLVGETWKTLFRQLQEMYGRASLTTRIGRDQDGSDLDLDSPRQVRVDFSWLVEQRAPTQDDDGSVDSDETDDDGHIIDETSYLPKGLVIFDYDGLATCQEGCLRFIKEDCHQRRCRHVSIRTILDLYEVECGFSAGMSALRSSIVISREELKEIVNTPPPS
ncbi:hypothetical protein MYCTH_2301533 [Thermothelomyces thermophilus ATCC 42464]|uniref:Uncharacterized protein n=1 Tax=Thermothelomyces thermophilus (strain ATCC 42464 / BCRC 31852 / DSM 1799) TaxID=573729 RepID=G2Q9P3_THET4|nr:uncharacterized protein MYCTH_2301533 [Thermothelomyces thermophilus ATCC 42464]AEO56502.1 hypothetical protein MYCTH_2301533 [Thermothelomyces thermophilus ATCC 42464]